MATAPTAAAAVLVGIDVAHAERVVAVRPGDGVTRWANDEAGHTALVTHLHLRAPPPPRVVLEATGGWAQAVGRPSLDRAIAAAREEWAAVEAAIAARWAAEPTGQAKRPGLPRVPGVGPLVAATLVAEVPELGTRGPQQVAALAGLAPRTQERGQRRGPAAIGGGRRAAGGRGALALAAVTAMRGNPAIRPCDERVLAAHNPKNLALVAAARTRLGLLTTPWFVTPPCGTRTPPSAPPKCHDPWTTNTGALLVPRVSDIVETTPPLSLRQIPRQARNDGG